MSEPTPEQLAEWRRVTEAARPGPWAWDAGTERTASGVYASGQTHILATVVGKLPQGDYDAEFIAASRAAMPALLDEAERLREFVEMVQHYHEGHGYTERGERWRPVRAWLEANGRHTAGDTGQ